MVAPAEGKRANTAAIALSATNRTPAMGQTRESRGPAGAVSV